MSDERFVNRPELSKVGPGLYSAGHYSIEKQGRAGWLLRGWAGETRWFGSLTAAGNWIGEQPEPAGLEL